MFLLTFCCSVVASGIAIAKIPCMQTTGDRGGLSVFLDICPLGTCSLNARDSRLTQLKHSRSYTIQLEHFGAKKLRVIQIQSRQNNGVNTFQC